MKYTVYFTIFGQKLAKHIEVGSKDYIESQLKSDILNSLTIDKVAIHEEPPKENIMDVLRDAVKGMEDIFKPKP